MSIAVGSTGHYAYTLTEPVTVTPFTISVWFKVPDILNNYVPAAIDTPIASGYEILGAVGAGGGVAGDPVRAYNYNGSSFGVAATTTGFSVDTWTHACGVFTSATLRAALIDGGSKGTNTDNIVGVPSEMVICRRRRSAALGSLPSGSYIAEVAVWSVALSDANAALLAGGTSPLDIDASNLIAYWPLTTVTTNTDSKGSNDLIESTTLTYSSDHPTISSPSPIEHITAVLSGLGAIELSPLTVTHHLGATTLSGLGSVIATPGITNANLLGSPLIKPPTLKIPGWHTDADAGSGDNWDQVAPREVTPPSSGDLTQVEGVPATENDHTGSGVLPGAGQLWFEMGHLIPRLVQDVGNLITEQTINCDLYNADRQNPITVSSVTNNLGIGFTVVDVPATPFDIASQESLAFSIKVLQAGDLIIDGDYTFTLSTGETFTIYIVGSRIVVLPIRPEGPLPEHLIWETKILPAIDASEQRIANRETPRGMFEFKIKEERKRAEMILFDRQSKLLAVPGWHEPSYLTSAGAIDDLTINVDTTAYGNFYVGGYAIVRQNSYIFDALKIESMTATSLTFDSGLTKVFAEGTEVMPLMTAYAEPTTPMVKAVYNDQTIRVKLYVDATPNDIADASAFSSYNGKVFLDDPNFLGDAILQEALRTKVYVLDNRTGDRSQFAQQIRSLRHSRKGFKTNSRQELWELRQLLHFLKGKQVSFYIPTFSKDLVPNSTLVVSNSTFTMDNIGYAINAQGRWSKKVFRLHLKNGTILTRTIQNSTEISATEEQLTVDTAWPYNIEPTEIERVEFIEKVRFNSDDIMILHQNACGWAKCTAPTVEVTDDDV